MPYQRMTKGERAERLSAWIELRLSGHAYMDIAAMYNVKHQTVQKAVTDALKARADQSVDNYRDQLIGMCLREIARLDAIDDEKYSDVKRKWTDQLAKLSGAYAVQQHKVEHSYTDGTVDDEIARLTAELAGNDPAACSEATSAQDADQHV